LKVLGNYFGIGQVTDKDYINFLVAAHCDVSCVKAAECYSDTGIVVIHDRFNWFLTRQSLTPETLWAEVEPLIEKRNGWLILDNTVIDKIYSERIELTYYQWSGKLHNVVKGIGLITLVWTDGVNTFPVDYRIYDKDGDEMTKNDHFREMLTTASVRGFQPYFILFDS
jgi:putative transposase